MTHGFARTLRVQPQPIGRLLGRNCSNVTDILRWLTSASPLPQPWWVGALYAIRALPDLRPGIVSERLETQVSLGFLLWLLEASARPGLSFCIARQSGW